MSGNKAEEKIGTTQGNRVQILCQKKTLFCLQWAIKKQGNTKEMTDRLKKNILLHIPVRFIEFSLRYASVTPALHLRYWEIKALHYVIKYKYSLLV